MKGALVAQMDRAAVSKARTRKKANSKKINDNPKSA